MSPSPNDLFLVYWAVWIALTLLPFLLHWGQRKLERWEILETHPEKRGMLGLRRVLELAHGVPLVLGLLLVLYSDWPDPRFVPHLAALFYGFFLLFEAILSWGTGLRPAGNRLRPVYVVEEAASWRTKLQLALAVAYLSVPIGFVVAGILL